MKPIPPSVVQKLAALRRLIESHKAVFVGFTQANVNNIYTTDLWFGAAINRSIHLIEGFATMVERRNAYCALPLVRLQLDTATRLFAITRIDDHDHFFSRVLRGEQVNRLRDRDGHNMTDRYLVDLLARDGREWIKRVYETTSGHIHMSGRHLRMMASPAPGDDRAILHHIGPIDDNWLEEAMVEAIDGFTAITDLILTLASEWWQRKKSMPLPPSTQTDPSSTPARPDAP